VKFNRLLESHLNWENATSKFLGKPIGPRMTR